MGLECQPLVKHKISANNGSLFPKHGRAPSEMSQMGYRSDRRMQSDEIFVRPSQSSVPLNIAAVWKRRSLVYFLTWRDIKVRYKQTLLGAVWVVLQPLLMMAVFSVVFGLLAKVPSDGIPYPVFTFCALVPWQLVANAFADAGYSLAANQNLITKVYFPRLIIPMSAVLARLIDFAFALLPLLAMLLYYGVGLKISIWTLPLFILISVAIGLGVGLWVSSLSLKYRDIRQMVPFFTQLWFFVSPIAYPASLIPESWRFLYAINPMVGVTDGFRWALLGVGGMPVKTVALSVAVTMLILMTGLYHFRRLERIVADVV
jgi:lipopolysaccharide transport system permease protein